MFCPRPLGTNITGCCRVASRTGADAVKAQGISGILPVFSQGGIVMILRVLTEDFTLP